VSNRNNLRNKIKKPNATQAFFNSYDTDQANNENGSEEIKKANDNESVVYDHKDNEVNKDNNINVDNKAYVNIDNNVVVEDESDDDAYLRDLVTGKKGAKRKANKKVFTSFYMDPDLATEVDKIAARGQKGDKSKLINTAIRKLLEGYGVIEKK
jgi:metal-responsive CopG/Arc/MetJ family transcriptional regulator